MKHEKQQSPEDHLEAAYDEAIEESFPASDAPAAGSVTRIERDGGTPGAAGGPPKRSTDDKLGAGKEPSVGPTGDDAGA